jgi:hypothetical protein
MKSIILYKSFVFLEPKLSKATVKAIGEAMERIKKGGYLTESEARKRPGL